MTEHDPRFDRWDAAYVMGALSAADRRDYEEHLSDCPRCRAEVAELNGLPGLLNRVPTARALALIGLDPEGVNGSAGSVEPVAAPDRVAASEPVPPADLAERLQQRHRSRRHRRVLTTIGAGLAAAVVAVALVLGIQSVSSGPARNPTLVAELSPAAGGPAPDQLSASVRLYAKAWGTEVDTECRHQVPGATPSAAESDESYGLFVIDDQGRQTLVSSWRGIPKSPIDTTAATAFRIEQMQRLELRSLPDRRLLLSANVHG